MSLAFRGCREQRRGLAVHRWIGSGRCDSASATSDAVMIARRTGQAQPQTRRIHAWSAGSRLRRRQSWLERARTPRASRSAGGAGVRVEPP